MCTVIDSAGIFKTAGVPFLAAFSFHIAPDICRERKIPHIKEIPGEADGFAGKTPTVVLGLGGSVIFMIGYARRYVGGFRVLLILLPLNGDYKINPINGAKHLGEGLRVGGVAADIL